MHTQSPADLLASFRWRYATKKFDPSRTIPPEIWTALEEVLVLTPSSFGLQPWRFLVVTDRALRDAIRPHAWGQAQVAECSHLVVFAAAEKLGVEQIDRYVQHHAAVRGTSVESLKGYRDMMIGSLTPRTPEALIQWAALQCYIALGQFMSAAAMLGVDTCPMEGFVPSEVDRLTGLAGSGYRTVVMCPAGYRAADDKYASAAKVRFPVGELVQHI